MHMSYKLSGTYNALRREDAELDPLNWSQTTLRVGKIQIRHRFLTLTSNEVSLEYVPGSQSRDK